MSIIDVNLFVGDCPFRMLPSKVDDLKRLREAVGLEMAIATSFSSLFYYDPLAGLELDLERYKPLCDWLSFFAVINPNFPQLEHQVERAARDERIVGLRLFPTLHHYSLNSESVTEILYLAAEHGLPVNLTARLTDDRVAPRYLNQAKLSLDALKKLLYEQRKMADKKLPAMILSMFFFDELQPLRIDDIKTFPLLKRLLKLLPLPVWLSLARLIIPKSHRIFPLSSYVEWSRLPQVYLDLGCSKPTVASFDNLPSWFPVERALFGSGAPLYYWKGSRLSVEGARLTENQKDSILGQAARGVFPWA